MQMKKMLVIIVILAMILVSMIIYKNIAINKNKSVNVQEVEQIEEYISKIYMWKEITKEALPTFENINNANELWVWEVIKKNLETYETTYEEIQQKGKELFGEKFERQIPKEGNDSFYYDKESNKYLATEIVLDEEEDSFLLKDIEKEGEKYKVKIIEYIEDYSEENKVIIRNLKEEEIGRVSTTDSETKIKEIVKDYTPEKAAKREGRKKKTRNTINLKISTGSLLLFSSCFRLFSSCLPFIK